MYHTTILRRTQTQRQEIYILDKPTPQILGSFYAERYPFMGNNVGMGLDPSAPLAARSALNRAEWRADCRKTLVGATIGRPRSRPDNVT